MAALFGVVDVSIALKADYNVAPCEAIGIIAATEPFSARPENGHRAADGSRRLFRARWGLVCGQASVQFDDDGNVILVSCRRVS